MNLASAIFTRRGLKIGKQAQMIAVPVCIVVHISLREKMGVRCVCEKLRHVRRMPVAIALALELAV